MGRRFILDGSRDLPQSRANETDYAIPRLRAGSPAQQCAKQKMFGTLLAMAPSPSSYRAAKKSHGQLGDFFAALKNGRGERGKGGA